MKKIKSSLLSLIASGLLLCSTACWQSQKNTGYDESVDNLPDPAEYQEISLPSSPLPSTGVADNVTAPTPSEYSRQETFTFRLTEEPETLDWNRAHTVVETHLLLNLMEGLVELDSNLRIVPALAQSWTSQNQGRRYVFKLREGVKWSDGQPLKAQDFITSWKRLLSSSTASPYAYLLFDIRNAREFYQGKIRQFSEVGVTALDDQTLSVELLKPVSFWLQLLTFWPTFPMREDLLKKHGASWTHPGHLVSIGPYQLSQIDVGQRIVLESNPHYYRERGNIKRVIGKVIKDDKTALKVFSEGGVDFVDHVNSILANQSSSNQEMRQFPYLKTAYLGFNTQSAPTADVHFRRAVSHAIDRRLFKSVLRAGQEPASTFVPPPLLGHGKNVGLSFDLQKARSELKKVGLPEMLKVQLELHIPTWEKDRKISISIQEQLKKNLGVNVSIQAFEYKTFRSQLDLQKFAFFQGLWGADYPDADNFLSIFLSESGINKTGWKSAEFDQRIIQARTMANAQSRASEYISMQKYLQEEVVAILPLYYEPITALVSRRLQGFQINPLNYVYLRKVNLRGD